VERGALVAKVGPDLSLGAMLGAAVSATDKWSAFLGFAEAVMVAKEVAERQARAVAALALRRRHGLAN